MDERPLEPGSERREVVERTEVVHGDATRVPERDRVVVHDRSSGVGWILLIPLLLIVLALLWYVFARGERQTIDVPAVEVPTVEAPAPDQRIEINLPERREVVPETPARTEPQP